ncbi:MAG: Ycf51 family protein [Jaaginema sp. PMC 1079.18]|nr:Ycf51 family protein [Jaaginema sp. PMC 1080.18]MEC4851847.1 Ycf51 family protein [Jaaginema sp. PMC 1079.18]MEC4864491.1 Ycf51 family protein [Jaaginema sp. PMC 1078.18]
MDWISDLPIPTDLLFYVKWSGIATIIFLVVTIIAFIVKWGIRFRLVGATSFAAVVTASFFALSLGLFTRSVIPGAIRYSLVYDNAADKVVIAVPPDVTESQVEATIRQIAADIKPYSRLGDRDNQFSIRARTVLHPEPGVSRPLYLGELRRSLDTPPDADIPVTLFTENFALLPDASEVVENPKPVVISD